MQSFNRFAPVRRSFLAGVPTNPSFSVSTVPANGDVNPYGVVATRQGTLVSNFNNSANQQGTGTTITRIGLNGRTSTFFQDSQAPGLSMALGTLPNGDVVVGHLPTTDGTSATVGAGSLLILNRNGQKITELNDPGVINGPWGMAVNARGNRTQLFIANVLDGTITRIDATTRRQQFQVDRVTTIGSGYAFRTDPAALVVGPAGLVFNARNDTLYVAATDNNAIFAIPNAARRRTDDGTGQVVYQDDAHLHGPLGLAATPIGTMLTTNSDAVNADPAQPSTVVEFVPNRHGGQFVNELSLNPNEGAAFGLAVTRIRGRYFLETANDVTNALDVRLFTHARRFYGGFPG